MKKFIVLFLPILIVLNMISTVVFAESYPTASIMVNNTTLNSNVSSINYNGVVLSPASELAASHGGIFSFDSSDYNYLDSKLLVNENELVFKLDSNIVQINGKYLLMPAPMKIINNRIMLPSQFVSQAVGAETFTHIKNNTLMIFQPQNNNIVYSVQSGDSLWKLSQVFKVSISSIQTLNSLSSDGLYIGQKLIIKSYTPSLPIVNGVVTGSASLRALPNSSSTLVSYLQTGAPISIIGKSGSWYKVTSQKGTGYISIWVASITQDISYTPNPSKYFTSKIAVDTTGDSISYESYTVVKGDTIWRISQNLGIPDYELLRVNNLTSSSSLYIGQILKYPIYNVEIKSSVNGLEMLDWFTQANYIFPIGKTGKVTDIKTGKSFMIKRTMGANHSDTETLSLGDTNTMKEVFGGSWTWTRRSFMLEVDGRKFAVSIAGMPHAGVDGIPYYQNVANRSDNYGYGPNLDAISGNGMNGHFDMYFLNGLRHKDNQIDPQHQLSVAIAGGLQ